MAGQEVNYWIQANDGRTDTCIVAKNIKDAKRVGNNLRWWKEHHLKVVVVKRLG